MPLASIGYPSGNARKTRLILSRDLVTYPRDNHGPLAFALYGAPATEPWHGFDARRRVVSFIEKAFGP